MPAIVLNRDLKKMVVEELRGEKVLDLKVDETVDHTGEPILDITVTLRHQDAVRASGKSLLKLLRRTSDYLLSRGDARFPHFHFVTSEEIAA
jgi:hypothetical protein